MQKSVASFSDLERSLGIATPNSSFGGVFAWVCFSDLERSLGIATEARMRGLKGAKGFSDLERSLCIATGRDTSCRANV